MTFPDPQPFGPWPTWPPTTSEPDHVGRLAMELEAMDLPAMDLPAMELPAVAVPAMRPALERPAMEPTQDEPRAGAPRRPAWSTAVDVPDDASRPLTRTVDAQDGYRFETDEVSHQLRIVGPAGERRVVGGVGVGPGQFRFPRGLAFLPAHTVEASRVFVCDAWNQRIQIFDGRGTFVGAFGGPGGRPGQFSVPSDIVLVRPRFDGQDADEDDGEARRDDWMLAVADSWNSRVQVFDLQGVLVAVLGADRHDPDRAALSEGARAGWPFFRLAAHPPLTVPSQLHWRAPALEVRCAQGVVTQIDLAHALLPRFAVWRRRCTASALAAARSHFAASAQTVPAAVLAQLDTDLGRVLLERHDTGGAACVWGGPWPQGLGSGDTASQLEQRCEGLVRAAPRSGGRQLVGVVAAQLAAFRRAPRARDEPLTPRGDGPRDTGAGGRSDTARWFRLVTRAARGAGATAPQGGVAWSAPADERALGQLAVGRGEVGLVSSDTRSLWVFDQTLSPKRQILLDRSLEPSSLAPDPSGGWLVGDEAWGHLIRVSGAQHRVEQGPVGSSTRYRLPVAVVATAERLYVAERGEDRIVVRDRSGRLLGGFLDIPGPLSIALDEESLWVATSRPAGLRRLDLHTGRSRLRVECDQLISPVQIALIGNGTVLVADASAGCVHLLDATGEWLGRLDDIDGTPLGRPSGVAVLDDTTGLVADRQHGRILTFALPSPETGWWRL